MVCPQCGTLNPDQRERCFRCEHSLAPARVAEEVTCHWHPNAVRAANCSVCGTPVCENCAIRVEDVAYCPDCAALPGEERLAVERGDMLTPLEMATYPLASAGWRLVAGLVDAFIIGSASVIFAFLIWLFTGTPPGLSWTGGINALFWTVILLGAGGFLVGYQVASGQTPGYGATDLLVVEKNGSAITVPAAILRYLVSLLSAACLMLGYLWILWDPDNQTWHDKAAGTVVLRTSERNDLPVDPSASVNVPPDNRPSVEQ
jgi:uncharacterized RDD family membrane protein YckC